MAEKYNYKDTLELLVNAHKQGKTVTYQEMKAVLGLEKPIEDKSAASTNNSILYEVRNRLRKEYGLVFKSAAYGNHIGSDYHYYTISEVKDSDITKKDVNSAKKVDAKEVAETVRLQALQKDNEKLYAEVQRLKFENQELREAMDTLICKEEEYKSIINSLMSLAGIS